MASGKNIRDDSVVYKPGDVVAFPNAIPFSGITINQDQVLFAIPLGKTIVADSFNISFNNITVYTHDSKIEPGFKQFIGKYICENTVRVFIQTNNSCGGQNIGVTVYMQPTITFT